ncbi:MAG TPA: GyrI-like domain-containing protein [Anseongella sp.]|nr:GyrI-like domain-containing protein [Anseongella sp.]
MQKTDLTRLYKAYYSAGPRPELIETGAVRYLSTEGRGDPSGKEFAGKIQALYATAYTLKFMYKEMNRDFTVAKLEGLWDFDQQKYGGLSLSEAPLKIPRSEWQYRLLIRLPDFVSEEHLAPAIEKVLVRKKLRLAREVSSFSLAEGKAVQILHTGPFDREPETLRQVQEFVKAHNLQKNGLHHEIYLSDISKTAPERLKTILREPVK